MRYSTFFKAPVFVLVLLLLVDLPGGSVATAAQPPDAAALLKPDDRVVFVGDSITGLGQNNSAGFIHLIDQAIKEISPEAKLTLTALGGSGQGVSSWRNVEKSAREKEGFLDVKDVGVKATLDAKADVLVIMLGMNDVLAPYVGPSSASLDRWADHYRILLEALKKRTRPRVIALATISPCTEDPDSPRNHLIGQMNQRIATLAKEQGAVLLPVNEAVFEVLHQGRKVDPSFHVTYDRVHPTAAGHLGIAIGMLRGLGQAAAAEHLETRVTALVAQSAASAKPIATPPAWLVGIGLIQPWNAAVFNPEGARTPVDKAIEKKENFTRPIALSNGKTLTWKKYIPSVDYLGDAAPGNIDFTALTYGETFESAYAAQWIHSNRARGVELKLSTRAIGDSYLTVWFNGKRVYQDEISKAPRRQAAVKVDLIKGWNVLALKSNHRTWQWQVDAHLAPLSGDDLSDLHYEAGPPSAPPATSSGLVPGNVPAPALARSSVAAVSPAPADFVAPVLRYHLNKPAQVTLVIEDEHGKRVRNLIAAAQRDAGDHEEKWDGLNDVGKPAAPGEYRWRGLTHSPISTHFQGAFNSPGDPPWITMRPVQWNLRDGTNGGWLSDHSPPLCSFATGDQIFLGAPIAEAGHSIIEVDSEGHKQLGILWLSLGCANALTVEGDVLYAASEKAWMGNWLAVNRFNIKTRQHVRNPPALKANRTDNAFVKEKLNDFRGIRGIVLTPRTIVLSLADHDRLAFFDRETATHIKDLPLPGAGCIIHAPSGAYLGISGKQVVRLDLDKGAHQPVITGNLDEPSGLAVDTDGTIYVTDLARQEQCIKVFSPEGKLLRRIGTPGGHHEGVFDPQAMSQPTSVSIDGRGQLWVTEHDFLPKRISVWARDGKLIRDFIGGPAYGGGGALDTQNPSRAYYHGLAFEWKDWPGGYRLSDILFRIEDHLDLPLKMNKTFVGQVPVHRNGRLYLVQDFNWGQPGVFIGEVREHHLVPRIIFGKLDAMREAWTEQHADFVKSLPRTAAGQGMFLWQDRNEDGKADPSEVTVNAGWRYDELWPLRVGPDLTLYALNKEAIIAVSPLAKTDRLAYDLDKAKFISKPPIIMKNGICSLAADLQGNLIVTCGGAAQQGNRKNVLLGLSPTGKVLWTYPNPYPANWHDSPRPHLGDIQHTLDVEGVAKVSPDAGDVFVLNGNKGVRYLFTTDGLFVDQLFKDGRFAPWQQTLPKAVFDMPMQDISLVDECFFGWFGRADDGRFLQVVGKDSSNVMEVRGLETIKRLAGGSITLTAAATPATDSVNAALPPIDVPFGGISNNWIRLGSRTFPAEQPLVRFALGSSKDDLYLHVEVTDDSPFVNAGDDLTTLFKTGDAVDFRLATHPALSPQRMKPVPGDVRIVLAMFHDKPVAVRYRFVVPGAKHPVAFGHYSIDEVSVLEGVRIDVKRDEHGYTLKARIPWTDLGLSQPPETPLRGDVGVIFSDPTGSRDVARHYYFDQGSQAVSDLPTEATVYPDRWGVLRF